MSSQYTKLVEKINRVVRDRGDVELMVLLDKIMDKESETEQAEALGAVVKILNQGKKPAPPASSPPPPPPPTPLASSERTADSNAGRVDEISHANQSSEEGA